MNEKTEPRNKNFGENFETSLAELEQLVLRLESGDLSLDESLSQFQRGIELTRHCQQLLENARQSVEKLENIDDPESAVEFKPEDAP